LGGSSRIGLLPTAWSLSTAGAVPRSFRHLLQGRPVANGHEGRPEVRMLTLRICLHGLLGRAPRFRAAHACKQAPVVIDQDAVVASSSTFHRETTCVCAPASTSACRSPCTRPRRCAPLPRPSRRSTTQRAACRADTAARPRPRLERGREQFLSVALKPAYCVCCGMLEVTWLCSATALPEVI
jgi:hypothetical protein